MRSLMQPLVLEEKMRLDARSFFHSCLISGDFDPPPGYLLGARAHERPLNKAAFAFSRERSLIKAAPGVHPARARPPLRAMSKPAEINERETGPQRSPRSLPFCSIQDKRRRKTNLKKWRGAHINALTLPSRCG
jgi:hypothetical protein